MNDFHHQPPGQGSILCLWLPNWPIQRLVAADNALRKTQIILYRNQPGRGQVVSAVSPAAELSGARSGMPLSEARSLAGRSRNYREHHVLPHDPHADLRALQKLAMDCQRFSPLTGLDGSAPPSGLLLDIQGVTHLFGGQQALRLKLHQYFQQQGYLVSSAIAPTIGRAWGLARFQNEAADGDFDTLPIEALRLEQHTANTLRQLGVNRISRIRSLPRAGLRSRFGDEITRRLDQADGLMSEMIEAIYPPADYQAETFLEYPQGDRETIQVIVHRLVSRLCQQMRQAGRGGLVWRFRLSPPFESAAPQEDRQQPVDLVVRVFQPVATPDALLPLVEMQLESLFQAPHRRTEKHGSECFPFRIQEVSVSVCNCVLLAERQRKLFDENPRLDKQVLAHLINRLGNRLGAEQVLRPVLQSGAKAEDAFYFEPLTGHPRGRQTKRRPPSSGSGISPLQRPLTLYAEPRQLQAVSLDGTRHPSSTVPAMFMDSGERMPVLRRWGPERIETAWWRGPVIRRDYWRIETDQNRWLWVYRNLQNRRWFLHGEF